MYIPTEATVLESVMTAPNVTRVMASELLMIKLSPRHKQSPPPLLWSRVYGAGSAHMVQGGGVFCNSHAFIDRIDKRIVCYFI